MLTRVISNYERQKEDTSDDSLFYKEPRFVYHLDSGFRKILTEVYSQYIPNDSVVLDLMSSWVSHLPMTKHYKKVIGHGMNYLELERNKQLDTFWIQNLNLDQKIPLETATVDFVCITAGWQYLQEPENIASELRRIIKPNGSLLISFSNRAFWQKTPNIWKNSTPNMQFDYISMVLEAQNWKKPFEYIVKRESNKSIFNVFNQQGDPFYALLAVNT